MNGRILPDNLWLLSVILIFAPTLVFGQFSAFVSLCPANERNHPEVKPTIVKLPTVVRITLPYTEKNKRSGKEYILVLTQSSLPSEKQDFRRLLSGAETRDDVVYKQKLTDLVDNRNPDIKVQINQDSILLLLPSSMAARAYIFYDFPYDSGSGVSDGGYFYSIDIPIYLANLPLPLI